MKRFMLWCSLSYSVVWLGPYLIWPQNGFSGAGIAWFLCFAPFGFLLWYLSFKAPKKKPDVLIPTPANPVPYNGPSIWEILESGATNENDRQLYKSIGDQRRKQLNP